MIMKIAAALLFTAWTASSTLFAADATKPGESCLIMPGEKTRPQYHADFDGRRYYFCCRPCVKKFKKDPKKYIRN